jgi:hypothetical protein
MESPGLGRNAPASHIHIHIHIHAAAGKGPHADQRSVCARFDGMSEMVTMIPKSTAITR